MSSTRLVTATLPSGAELTLVSLDDGRQPRDVSALQTLNISEVLDSVSEFAELAVERVRALAPDELEFEFGIGVSASSGKITALLVGAGADASMSVRLLWKQANQEASGGSTE